MPLDRDKQKYKTTVPTYLFKLNFHVYGFYIVNQVVKKKETNSMTFMSHINLNG